MTAPADRAAVVFRVGARVLAASAAEVAAVARRPALTRAPHAPPALAGVGALNGRATPVIELARLLGEGEGGGCELLVLEGETAAAVAVDRVEGVRERDRVSADWLDLRRTVAGMFRDGARAGRREAAAGPSQPAARAELSFVEFSLGRQRFALPIAETRAVIRAPAELTEVPGADPVIVGLAPHDSGALPVVELAALLGLPAPGRGAEARLVVVEIGGAPVGLRVERVLGVLRVETAAVTPAPAVLNRGRGEARIAAIARTASGLTAILSSGRLFDAETTRRLEASAAPAQACAAPAASGESEPVLVFRVGGERYGLPAAAVEATARASTRLSPAPNAPPFLAGVTAHRGRPTPVIDLRARFGCGRADAGAIVFVQAGDGAVGWLVDAVERLARVGRDALERAPPLAGDAGALFARVAAMELDGRPLLVVDTDEALAQARRDSRAADAARPRKPRP